MFTAMSPVLGPVPDNQEALNIYLLNEGMRMFGRPEATVSEH